MKDDAIRLPALIDWAGSRLAETRTLQELLDARAVAMAARHYARVTKASNETQAGCLLLIKRAEIRLADEIDAMQDRGELARPRGCGKPTRFGKATKSNKPVTCPSADQAIVDG